MDIITRQEAIAIGVKTYYTGVPCRKGHLSQRRVQGSSCLDCNRTINNTRKYYSTARSKATSAAYRKNNPKYGLLEGARHRAKMKGLAFDLCIEDVVIPDYCPILGVPLVRCEGGHPGPNSPTLDRIVPALGYIKGNVCVISHRANTIKNDATVEELLAIIQYIQTHTDRNPRVLQ